MKSYTKVLWGLLFVVFGLIIGINALGFAEINLFFDGWWTLFIIVPSAIGLVTDDDKKGSIFGLFIGILLLLMSRDVISLGFLLKLIFPGILLFIGLSILWDEVFGSSVKEKIKTVTFEKELNYYSAIFGEDKHKITKEFKGASVDAIFGEVKFDLRKAKVVDGAVLKVSAIFGSAEVLLPDDVEVKAKTTKIFGGVENDSEVSDNKKVKTLYVEAFSLFGGIEIK